MKHLKRTLLIVTMVLGFVGLASPPTHAQQSTGVNNFYIADYQIEYYLSQDAEGHSRLKTVETIEAVFPETNQNHGIERAVPKKYDGHTVALSFAAVKSATGATLNSTTYDSNGLTVLRIGDANTYVHGKQTYVIEYTQKDVTKYFQNTDDDEFYWDTNGVEWKVPINKLSARLHIDEQLAKKLNNKQQCYIGIAGSNQKCGLLTSTDGVTAIASNLKAYENLTIAVGFTPHTFAVYKQSTADKLLALWVLLTLLTAMLSIFITVWLITRAYKKSNRTKEVGTIVPEYIPPKNASVTTSGSIMHSYSTMSAQLIDLAVRHYLKIYQTSEKSLFKTANYELEIIRDISDLRTEEQELLSDLFDQTSVGSKLDMASLKRNYSVGVKLSDNPKKLAKSINGEYGLRAKNNEVSGSFKRIAGVLFLLGLLTLSPFLLVDALISLLIGVFIKPLTDSGLELVRYLKGLDMYIKVAEVERIKMLQSPEGAAKMGAPIDTNDKRQMVKLYERVLPYAMLFGHEKEWNKQLGLYYESINESPGWYVGTAVAFNAASFSSAMSNFSAAASYSDPSGGSGGGGSSGGGGGGGGGGGW